MPTHRVRFKKMKVALIGAGVIGKVHARVLADMNADLAAICDIETKKAEEIALEFSPSAKIYTDWREMLSCEKIDVVHICTPHYLHAEQVIASLDMGINVLCEKPLCAHEGELRYILEAEARSTARLGVCHQNRYNETVAYARELIGTRKITAAHASVVWHRDENYYYESLWRGKLPLAGGGSLINQALHTLDLLRSFVGEPTAITARAEIFMPKIAVEVEDTVTAVLEMGDGSACTFFSTNNAAKNFPVELNFKLEGGDEILVMPKAVILNGKTVFDTENPATFGKSYYGGGHASLFADFYDCLENGRDFLINGAEAAKVMKLIFAIYKSRGRRIEL